LDQYLRLGVLCAAGAACTSPATSPSETTGTDAGGAAQAGGGHGGSGATLGSGSGGVSGVTGGSGGLAGAATTSAGGTSAAGAPPTSGGSGGAAGSAGSGGGGRGGRPGGAGSGGISGQGGRAAGFGGAGTSGQGASAGTSGGGRSGAAGSGGSAGAGASDTVCGILAAAGNACAAAHSTTRVLYPGYGGPLYQVCKGSSAPGPSSCTSGMMKDIGSVGGYADSAAQDAFCSGGSCTISIIYDQSPNGNDLKPAPPGGAKNTSDNPANATDAKTTLAGHTVYGVLIKANIGYRAGCTGCDKSKGVGTATGDQAETQYIVTSQKDLIDGCCFDYGNAETSDHDDGEGTMEALYFGGGVVWGTGSPGGHNNGPWVMADLENGLYAGWENNQDQNISTNTPLKHDFVTAVLIGDTSAQNGGKGRFALYGGDATTGTLKTMYDGVRPTKAGYVPMKKQGSIILGIGGDNSNGAGGRWYEGVMASGAASAATLDAVQANVVAAQYGK